MKILEKFILFIKNMFNKKEEPKQIEAPRVNLYKNQREDFLDSLRLDTIKKKKKKKFETLICKGDGLGIRKKLSY